MHLTHLSLANFRNYARLELDLAPGITLLQGNNASGKTSLLEAVFYLATSRSLHAKADRELVRWDASDEPIPFARVEADIAKRNDTHTQIEIVLVQANDDKNFNGNGATSATIGRVSKRIKVNGVNKRALDLLGELNAVLFLPDDLNLVFGSPGDRRRYLDITLSQIDPRYGRALSKYNQVLEQRNSLLREFRERAYNPHELAIWDKQLIDQGAYVIFRRAEAIQRYNGFITEIHPRLTDANERLRLFYQPNIPLETTAPISVTEITRRFARQIETLHSRELAAAITLVGPHRDDLRFFIDRLPNTDAPSIDMNTYASRGQGRTVALSLKLAEVALMRAETGETPVLLLDDVMSELDAPRRAALAQTLLDSPQAIVTATDLADFPPEFLDNARILRVTGGVIEE